MSKYHLTALMLLAVFFLLAACGGIGAAAPTETPIPPTERPTLTSTVPPTATFTLTPTATFTLTPSLTATPTETSTPTETPTPTFTPTPDTPMGTVVHEQLSCRFGPGVPYLFKFSVFAGQEVTVVGRNEAGTWAYVRTGAGPRSSCWVSAGSAYMSFNFDLMSAPVVDIHITLPWSPYYGPLENVNASRSGGEVIVTYDRMVLRAGDDSEQYHYLLEAWVCRGGELVFVPVGSNNESVSVIDEGGCDEASHGRVMGVEKHGYTRWVVVPWP